MARAAKTKAAQPAPQAPVPTATPVANSAEQQTPTPHAKSQQPRSWPAHETADWAIDKLTPYARNPRLHSPEQIAQLAKAIQHFGFTNRVLIDEDGTIIAGHGRVLAAELLKLDTVPVMIARGWSAEDRRAYVIWDNQSSLNATWDEDLLKGELFDLAQAKYDLDLTGIPQLDLVSFLSMGGGNTDPDATPEAPVAPISKRGDHWLLGRHRVVCGDATDSSDAKKCLGGARSFIVFADAPYGMKLDADFSSEKSSLRMLQEKGLRGGRKYENVIGDHEFSRTLIDCLFDNFLAQEMFLWGADYFSELLRERELGSWFVWDKRLDETADRMYGSGFELCWSRRRHKREMVRVKWAGVFGVEKEPDRRRFHPTQKPVELSRWFIERHSSEGGIVVDPYVGAGGTIIAAEMTKRACYALEIEPGYTDVVVQRWQAFAGKAATLDGDGRTFDEIAKERTAAASAAV